VEWNGGGAQWNPENVAGVALQAIFDHLPDDLKNQALPDAAPEAPAVDLSEQTDHTKDGEQS